MDTGNRRPCPPPHSIHTLTNHHEPTNRDPPGHCPRPRGPQSDKHASQTILPSSTPYPTPSSSSTDMLHQLYSGGTVSALPPLLLFSVESSYGEALPTRPVPIFTAPDPLYQFPLHDSPPCGITSTNPPTMCPIFPPQVAPGIPMVSLTKRLYNDINAPQR